MQGSLFGPFEGFSSNELVAELTRRYAEAPPRPKISSPQDIVGCLTPWMEAPQEYFFSVCLDGSHRVIKTQTVSIGTANRTVVHPREVFRTAIEIGAVAIAVAHNHPSGNVEPSPEDDEVTRRLREAGEIVGIPVLDHVIIGGYSYYSYLESGRI